MTAPHTIAGADKFTAAMPHTEETTTMTKDQFNRAVELLQNTAKPHEWNGTEAEQDRLNRVVGAAACVIKHRRGIPDDAEWTMPTGALEEFLSSLTPGQLRKLKRIADSLISVERVAIH